MWTTKWPIMCECESTENNPAFVTFFAFAQVTSPAFNLSDKLTVHSFFLQPVKCLYLRLFCRHVPRGGITPTGEGFPQIKRWRNYRQASVNAHILNLIGNILTVQRVPWQKHRDGCCHLSFLCTRLFSKKHTQKNGKCADFSLIYKPENEAPLPIVPYAIVPHVSYIRMIYWRQKWEKDCNAMKF